jgi:hypothetical protein
MSAVCPTGIGRSKFSSSIFAVTQVSPANRIAESPPRPSSHFMTFPPWALPKLFEWFGWTSQRFSR